MSKLTPFFLVVATLIFAGCKKSDLEGSGSVTTQQRSLTGFTELEVSGKYDVVLTEGPYAVTVEADDNLIGNTETVVVNGRVLRIGSKKPVDKYNRLRVYVTAPNLTRADVSGASQLRSSDTLRYGALHVRLTGNTKLTLTWIGNNLTVDQSGNCEATLAGSAASFRLEQSGNCKTQAGNLMARNVSAQMNGNCEATVYATETLNANLTGNCKLFYRGSPQITQETTGNSSIQKTQ